MPNINSIAAAELAHIHHLCAEQGLRQRETTVEQAEDALRVAREALKDQQAFAAIAAGAVSTALGGATSLRDLISARAELLINAGLVTIAPAFSDGTTGDAIEGMTIVSGATGRGRKRRIKEAVETITETSPATEVVTGIEVQEFQKEFVKLVETAAKRRVSDIHFIVDLHETKVEFRVNGVIEQEFEKASTWVHNLCQVALAMADNSDFRVALPSGVQSVRLQSNGRELVCRLLYENSATEVVTEATETTAPVGWQQVDTSNDAEIVTETAAPVVDASTEAALAEVAEELDGAEGADETNDSPMSSEALAMLNAQHAAETAAETATETLPAVTEEVSVASAEPTPEPTVEVASKTVTETPVEAPAARAALPSVPSFGRRFAAVAPAAGA